MPRYNPPTSAPLIVYLDQNMWIDLARAVRDPDNHPEARQILEALGAAIDARMIATSLTASNLYETQKVRDPMLRATIAHTQVAFSGGWVFRGRRRRLEVEAARVLSEIYDLPWTEPEPGWFLSNLFFEAQADLTDPRMAPTISPQALKFIADSPAEALFDYLLAKDEPARQQALMMFEAGADDLRQNIEERRFRHRDQLVSMKRRISSVLIFNDDQDTLIAVAERLGLPWRCFADNKGATMRRMISEVPTLNIERELSLKLESQKRAVHINDFSDMLNFTTALPYADVIVAEKQFVNLARQSGVADRYPVRLETKLSGLMKYLQAIQG